MADTKISELPVATAIATPDVVPIVQGGVTKKVDVSLFGSLSSHVIARVDPSGSNSTGAVGNLSKPFLTVQAAIDAVAALIPAPTYAAIDIGLNVFAEDVTIAFRSTWIVFTGVSSGVSKPFNSLTLGTGDGNINLYFSNCSIGTITQTGDTQITLGMFTCILRGDITGDHVYIKAYAGCWARNVTINITSDGTGDIRGLGATLDEDAFGLNHRLDVIADTETATTVTLRDTVVRDVTCDQLTLSDSVVIRNITADTVTYGNLFFDPSTFDFSTLPTSEPDRIGAAWIDTTGGFNIVKVHL